MRGPLYFAAAALVAASAVWAYRVNYAAQEGLDRVAALRGEIRREREAIVVLRAEIAHLSAPDRLRRLAAATGADLSLAPLSADAFAAFDALPTPPPEAFWARADPAVFMAQEAAP